MKELAKVERERLAELEGAIHDLGKAWRSGCLAMDEIHANKLYREGGQTWNDYLESKWGMSEGHGYRLLEAAKVIQNLSARRGLTQLLPESEFQIRELAKLPPEKQLPAWEKAIEIDAAASPKAVRKAVQSLVVKSRKSPATRPKTTTAAAAVATPTPPPPPAAPREIVIVPPPPAEEPTPSAPMRSSPTPVDELGEPLPDNEKMRAAFAEGKQIADILNRLVQIKKDVRRLGESVTFLRIQQFEADITNARSYLKIAKPHAVCPYCRGGGESGGSACNACRGGGWVSEGVYESAPTEMKSRKRGAA